MPEFEKAINIRFISQLYVLFSEYSLFSIQICVDNINTYIKSLASILLVIWLLFLSFKYLGLTFICGLISSRVYNKTLRYWLKYCSSLISISLFSTSKYYRAKSLYLRLHLKFIR